ncbi:heavy metal sensor histidine kinase [Pseudomonas sp. CFII64]|uniref:heavy metal sensor histidine kinase n=1 Tax=Pseudomonas sp. CFII64 TaxID=911242 RepID=UPI0003578C99|nr:heavy metal sensor histidine kinase [Pseudomonas sp. CFII64]
MIRRISLASRLALLFAACTAVVSLTAGVLFNHASETHFMELDQQLLDSKLPQLRNVLNGVSTREGFITREAQLRAELSRQPDLALRVSGVDGAIWFDNSNLKVEQPGHSGLHTLSDSEAAFRIYGVPLQEQSTDSPQLTLMLDITHHQHFLQRMQRLIWLTIGLSALATALLGAWAARSGLRPLRQMSQIAASVSASSLTTRLPQEQMPSELAELALAFNAMLGRLEDAFQRLSAFSADIAHELRTPLSNLLTHTQVILTRERPLEDYREALLGNLEEVQGMAQMVNDMLYLAKAEHGLLIPVRERLELHAEANAVLEFFAPLAEDAHVSMSCQGQAAFAGDRTMLRRVFSNLLDNALRFTPAGGYIKVSLDNGQRGVAISIENNGPTIDPQSVSRLFDRFYRADPARRESHEHAGLGLAITRSIVQAHGGTIRCESAKGVTRFLIALPL